MYKQNEEVTLPVPTKNNAVFDGWYKDANFKEKSDNVINLNSNLTLYAKWIDYGTWVEDLKLDTYFGNNINASLTLPSTFNTLSVEYNSSNPNVFSNTGVYTRPYVDTNITVTVKLLNGTDVLTTKSYDTVVIEGFKDLSGTKKTGYVYTNYSGVTDQFFDTLDIIYCAFTIADNSGNLTVNSSYVKNYIMEKAHKQGCWVIMSIGPNSEWTTIANPDNDLIDTFATNIVNAINEYGFDGVDIDWEAPTTAQKTWFTSLMQTVYQKVKANNPNHLVTAAIGGGMWLPPRYDLSNSSKYLDYINVMCYDLSTANAQYQNALYASTSYNDQTNKVGWTLTSCSIDETVKLYNKTYSVSYSKLIIGIPFYGVKQVKNSENEWKKSGTNSYNDIKNNYLSNDDYKYVFDNTAKVPYLIKTDYTEFISFEDPTSIGYKCKYIVDNKLGGIMYWQNGQNITGELLAAIAEGIK